MATVNLGRIKFVWQGAYSGATAYVADDVVSYNGSSYICILASTNNLPTNTTYWSIMSSAGTNGTNGTDVGTTITTQGDILYRNASGLARLGAGTNGQVLTTAGASANPSWSTVSSDFVKLATLNPSAVGTVSFEGFFSASYDNYKIIGLIHKSSTDDQIKYRFTQGGTPLNSDYYSSWTGAQSDGSPQMNNGHPEGDSRLLGRQVTTNVNYPIAFEILIGDPNNNIFAKYKTVYGNMSYTHEGGYHVTQNFASVNQTNTNALSGFRIQTNGGTFTGRIVLYGIK
jgi:hypothetical protein